MAVVAKQAVILRADISTGSCMASPVASNFMISPEQSATMVICALRPHKSLGVKRHPRWRAGARSAGDASVSRDATNRRQRGLSTT
ncbi:hypothetical protein [Mesorhizobium sp.]|uniref:hypothetical protein n=1 Tax=Mesorhizobium sp. TaxID=1871066 RepID=UPI000FE6B4F4|nr:hypothetical protein [Mesorhizobium sp.]RWQ61617.1 MAG: hypothetical protein EOS83_00695 [Mesorhizobium sp.]